MTDMLSAAKLWQVVWDHAASLPDVERSQAFGTGYEVFKVKGKVFVMTTEVPGHRVVTLKCDPERSKILRETHETITVGYHMNKEHWISIAAGPGVTRQLVRELVGDAYRLVVASLPRAKRPAAQYGRTRVGSLPAN